MSILQTLDRGLEAIEIISRSTGGAAPQELADALDVHRAVAYRILATLENRQLATRGQDGFYRLGSGVLAVADRYMSQYRTAAQPVLQKLADQTSMTSFMAVADGVHAVALAVAEPAARESIGISYRIGSRHPLDRGADGLAILAQRAERPSDIEAVRLARRTGVAVSDGQLQPGAVGLAVGLGATSPTHIETSIGVIRLGQPGDLNVDRLRSAVETARDSLTSFY